MIEARAIVTAIIPHATHPLVSLEIERQTACGLCGRTQGCGNQIWGRLLGHQQSGFYASNQIGAKLGQSVIVAMDEHAVMQAALLLYFVPLVLMLVTAAIGQVYFQTNGASIVGAILGLLLTWRLMKGFLAKRPQAFSYPEVVRLVVIDAHTSSSLTHY